MSDFSLYFQAILQGIVEGVTEFLPVSSTGHMIIVDSFWPMVDSVFARKFEVVIQLGAILSVIVYFYKKIFPSKWNISGFAERLPLWLRIVIGVIPAGIIGFLLDDFIEEKLFNVIVVAVALVVWGIVLTLTGKLEKWSRGNSLATDSITSMKYWQVIAVGFAQCLAMIPGTSRSAVTIIAAMCLGCTRACAAEFSFFLAIPTMFGAALLTMAKGGMSFSVHQWIALSIGFVTAFLVAWGVIAWFMDYISRRDFKLFGWYRIVLGVILLTLFVLHVLN